MAKVVIMRGIPGSGKSTYIANNYAGATVASADHFFMKNGKYQFNMALIGRAHDYCWQKFEGALLAGEETVIVDNTNVKVRDMSRYVNEAKKRGYEVEIVRFDCPAAVAAKRGAHNVPLEATERMAKSLAESVLPADYPTEIVVKSG